MPHVTMNCLQCGRQEITPGDLQFHVAETGFRVISAACPSCGVDLRFMVTPKNWAQMIDLVVHTETAGMDDWNI